MTYTYSTGDLLIDKPVYNFASFQGLPFLDAYRQSRRDWLASVASQAGAGNEGGDFPALLEAALAPSESGSMSLRDYLRGLLPRIRLGADAIQAHRFPSLLQRFEVTKRLWTAVDPEFRPTPGATSDCVEVYALFSLCCLLAYEARSHLSFLNAALKANDILCSQPAAQLTAAESYLLSQAIELELSCIGKLTTQAGIDWK